MHPTYASASPLTSRHPSHLSVCLSTPASRRPPICPSNHESLCQSVGLSAHSMCGHNNAGLMSSSHLSVCLSVSLPTPCAVTAMPASCPHPICLSVCLPACLLHVRPRNAGCASGARNIVRPPRPFVWYHQSARPSHSSHLRLRDAASGRPARCRQHLLAKADADLVQHLVDQLVRLFLLALALSARQADTVARVE
jgi:hypothetical protein